MGGGDVMAAAVLPEEKPFERAPDVRGSVRVVLNIPAAGARSGRRGVEAPGPARPLGVITASRVEAACWRAGRTPHPALTFASGSSAMRARAGVQQMLERGAAGLVSFGLALGLAPALRPGDLLVASGVVLPSGVTVATDGIWRRELLERLAPLPCKVHMARVVGGERLPHSVAEKRRAFMATAAAAIDTESCAVAEAAGSAGLPFLAVRAIVDPAEEARPAAAIASLGADGGTRSLVLAAHLVARPGEIAAMWRFAHSGRLALATLREVVRLMPYPPELAPAAVLVASTPRLGAAVSGA
jgi:adenosylhomocysteine nucleosidase